MKIEINTQPDKTPPQFPKLMTSENGDCVLLALQQEDSSSIKAIVLKHTHPTYSIGYTSVWPSAPWKDFTGTITLSNDA